MRWPKKPLIPKKCNYCSKVIMVTNKRARFFKFCSNECKINVSRQKEGPAKLQPEQFTFIKCNNQFCNLGRYYRDWKIKLHKNFFCSKKCHHYFMSKQYKLDIAAIQKVKEEEIKRSIWGRF